VLHSISFTGATSKLIRNFCIQTIDLKREPYPAEVEEAVKKELEALTERNALKRKKKYVQESVANSPAGSVEPSSDSTDVEQFVRKWGPVLKRWKPLLDQLEGVDFEEYESEEVEEEEPETRVEASPAAIENVDEQPRKEDSAPEKCGPSAQMYPSKSDSAGIAEGEEQSASAAEENDEDHLSDTEDCIAVVEQPLSKSAHRQVQGKDIKNQKLTSVGAITSKLKGVQPLKTPVPSTAQDSNTSAKQVCGSW
jgi:hypothetical protein